MSYTLKIEPQIVKCAESCAVRNGTTLDAMIRACLLVLASCDAIVSPQRNQVPRGRAIKIGAMKGEIQLPGNFDEAFDSLDDDIAMRFNGDGV